MTAGENYCSRLFHRQVNPGRTPKRRIHTRMSFLHYIADFGAGVFICNCLPHLASGLRGERLPTPFAKPPGTGLSSALTNALWGFLNLVIGWALLAYAPVSIDFSAASLLFLAGFAAIAVQLSLHFASVRDKNFKP